MTKLKVAMCVPLEKKKYVIYAHGRWHLDTPLTLKELQHYLQSVKGQPVSEAGHDAFSAAIEDKINSGEIPSFFKATFEPGKPEFFSSDDGSLPYLNLWEPPTLIPEEGDFNAIKRILTFLLGEDTEGYWWFVKLLARKVQNPRFFPRVAPVFITEQGAGKGVLFRVLSEILGQRNCSSVSGNRLTRNFNADWASKVLVMGNELSNEEGLVAKADLLKELVADSPLKVEEKFVPVREQPNYIMWLFTTNHPIPMLVEKSDRRFSFFHSKNSITQDYKDFLDGLFDPKDRETMQPHLVSAIKGFAHYLKTLPLEEKDFIFTSKPIQNTYKDSLVQATLPLNQLFMQELFQRGPLDLARSLDLEIEGGEIKNSLMLGYGDGRIVRDGVYTWKGIRILFKKYAEYKGRQKVPSYQTLEHLLINDGCRITEDPVTDSHGVRHCFKHIIFLEAVQTKWKKE